MRFIMKHISKKMLSVILALMILLSVVSVAFSAFAVEDPYVVKETKPAIAMLSGYRLNLNKISVEFGSEIVPGNEIIWDATPNGAIDFKSEDNTLTVFKKGTYTITAAKASDPENPRTITVIATDERATEAPIYEYKFSSKDEDSTSDPSRANSDWAIVKEGTNKATYSEDGGLSFVDNNTSGYLILKPEIATAKQVSAFSDIVVEAELNAKGSTMGTAAEISLMAKVTYPNGDVTKDPDKYISTIYRAQGKAKPKLEVNGKSVQTSSDNYTAVKGKYLLKVEGSTVKAGWTYVLNKENTYKEYGFPVDFPVSDAVQAELNNNKNVCGTIAFFMQKRSEAAIKNVKVSICFSEDELDKIQNACEKHGYYLINPNKPAIPVTVGQTLYFDGSLVEFEDGIYFGKDLNWNIETNGAAIFDPESNSLAIFKADTYTATATVKNDPTKSQEIFIIASESDQSEYEIYSHDFTDADFSLLQPLSTDPSDDEGYNKTPFTTANKVDVNGTQNTAADDIYLHYLANYENKYVSNPDSDWALVNSSKAADFGQEYTINATGQAPENYDPTLTYKFTYNADQLTAQNYWKYGLNQGIAIGTNQAGWMYLKPDSDPAKLISRFDDYNINYTYVTQNNGTGESFKLLGKFSANTADYSVGNLVFRLGEETYIGSKIPYGTTDTPETERSKLLLNSGNKETGGAVKFMAASGENNVKLSFKGNNVTLSMKKPDDATYKEVYSVDSETDIAALKGTIAIENANATRQYSKSISVTISFDEEEKAAASDLCKPSPYHIINDSKPVIPTKASSEVSLEKLVFEMSDGSYRLGKDVLWGIDNGAVKYNEQRNTISVYTDGAFPIRARLNPQDEGKEIYLITPNKDGQYIIYEHTFTEADFSLLKPLSTDTGNEGYNKTPLTNPNRQDVNGTTENKEDDVYLHYLADYANKNVSNPESDWNLVNSAHAAHYGQELTINATGQAPENYDSTLTYKFTYNADQLTAQNYWRYGLDQGIAIGTNASAWIYLKPESPAGKLISKFTDYTINYTYDTNISKTGESFKLLGKFSANTADYSAGKAVFRLGEETYIGSKIPYGTTDTPETERLNLLVASGNKEYGGTVKYGAASGKNNVRLKISGNNVTLSMKSEKAAEYTQVYSAESGIDVSKLTGTIAIENPQSLRHYNTSISVAIDFTEEELGKFITEDFKPLYTVYKDYPALPIKQGHKLLLADILVETGDKTYATGDKLDWKCICSTSDKPSDFFLDNEEKAVYAYGEGRYDVVVTDPSNSNAEVATIHFIVSSDGVYRLFNHTFTMKDAEAMTATGSSDMWIASFHTSTVEKEDYNGTKNLPNSWTNSIIPLTINGSIQFDATKGISLNDNRNMLLTLNPEHYEAKIISKFRDYNIDFTSTARDKGVDKSAFTDEGYIGALGRVDFGADGKLNFVNGEYLTGDYIAPVPPYNPDGNNGRISIKPGTVINFSDLYVKKQADDTYTMGDSYDLTNVNDADKLVIDSKAKTITAKEPGVYHINASKNGSVVRTISFVVTYDSYIDHYIFGSFYVTQKATPAVKIGTAEGYRTSPYKNNTVFDRAPELKINNKGPVKVDAFNKDFKYTVPETYNYRLSLKGNDIAFYVAPNGTINYTELYDTAKDTSIGEEIKMYDHVYSDYRKALASSNQKNGTIALYSMNSSRAFFKSVSVSLEFDSEPEQTSLGECYDEDSRLIYLQVGQSVQLKELNFEVGDKYHNGANLTFSKVPAALTIKDGKIIANAPGVHTLTATTSNGTAFTITVAVSAAGSLFNNGNYKFTHEAGVITRYSRIDTTQPYSEYVLFPSELDGQHIYEIGPALATGNPNNTQLVEIEIEKYIEKIGNAAFNGATKLQKVTIPNTVEEIGSSAFQGATKLNSVFIPGSVSKIGDYAFQNCGIDGKIEVIISNPDAVIGKDAFTTGAKLYGFEGSTAQKYAAENEGVKFEALKGTAKTDAEKSYNEWVKFEADRYTKVNTTVEWEWKATEYNGIPQYRIIGFKFTDRSAGKFVVPSKIEITENGVKKTVSVYPGEDAFGNKTDSRAVYAVELEEGITSMGFHAFENCKNLRDVKLPKTLNGIAQRAFQNCTSLEKIDIPDAVVSIGLYAFDGCTNLKEVNINPETSRLQALGMNAARIGETPGKFLDNTKVEKFVLPVTVDRVTNSFTNYSSIKEIWIYNKDLEFSITTTAQPYYFPMNTIIHGVPGSTAEAIVKADEALKDHEDPEKRRYYRALKFVGDIEDFYTTQENELDAEGYFTGNYVEYEPIDDKTSKKLDSPYYVITGFVGKGGKVIMPSHIDIGGVKNAPIYAVSSSAFQFEGNPTNGIARIITLEFEEGIAAIEDEAFKDTIHLKNVKFPSTLRYIGAQAFNGSGITGRLEIPKNVTEIGRAAFRGIENLKEVVILNPNLVFGRGIFDPEVVIHGIKGSTAQEYAEKNGHDFVEIEAPSAPTVSDFTDNANYKFTVTDGYITGYERLDSSKPYSLKVTIPATIGGVAIKGIAEGTFEEGAEATSVFAVEIQNGITDIGKNAFKGLKKLTYVTFPNTLKTIGEAAFDLTDLAGDLVLPESLEKIEKDAFKNLKYINSITVLSRTVIIEATSFPRNNPNLIIYGYTGSTAEEWAKNFKIAFEYLDGGPQEDEKDEETDYTEDPSDVDEDDDGENEVVRIIKQSNLALVIVIAIAMLLLAILLAAAVIVIVIIKKKLDEEEEALA